MTKSEGYLFLSFDSGFEPGATYRFAYMARNKSEGVSKIAGYITHWTDNWGAGYQTGWHELDRNISNKSWQKYSYEFVVPAGYNALQIPLICNEGEIDVDNFSILKIKEPDMLSLQLDNGEIYQTQNAINDKISTIETEIILLKKTECTLFSCGDYVLKLDASGHPVLNVDNTKLVFDKVSINTEEKAHIAITISDNIAILYLNGEEKQTLSHNITNTYVSDKLTLGAETVNLYSLTLYNKVLTQDIIKKDIARVEYTDENLIVAYDFTNPGNGRLEDFSKNDNHLTYFVDGEEENFDTTGLSINKNDTYIAEVPVTYEAEVNLSKELLNHEIGGVILGNDMSVNSQFSAISFGISGNGNPSIYYRYYEKYDSSNNNEGHLTFENIDVRTDKWTKVSISLDFEQRKGYCFINDELTQTLNMDEVTAAKDGKKPTLGYGTGWQDLMVGGDYHYDNENYFRGKIKNVSTWNQLAKDNTEYKSLNTDNAVLHYDMTHDTYKGLTYNQLWKREMEEVKDYKYSVSVVGDTQTVMWHGTKEDFDGIYDYITEEAINSGKMAYCIGLGDITEKGQLDWEYERAAENFKKLQNIGLPYSLIRGNHDVGSYMDKHFPYEDFKSQIGGSYEGSLTNTWQTFKADGNII